MHKLLVGRDRSPAFQAKARKDLVRAALVLEALEELRPGDATDAVRIACGNGKRWRDALARGARLLAKHDARLAKLVRSPAERDEAKERVREEQLPSDLGAGAPPSSGRSTPTTSGSPHGPSRHQRWVDDDHTRDPGALAQARRCSVNQRWTDSGCVKLR